MLILGWLSVSVCLSASPPTSCVWGHTTVSLVCLSVCLCACLSVRLWACLCVSPLHPPVSVHLTVCLTIACQTPRVLSNLWHNAASVEKILGTKNKLKDSGAGGQNYEEKHSEDAMKNIWGL